MGASPTVRPLPVAFDHETRLVMLIGLLSGALYGIVYWAQRSIFLNGLYASIGGVLLFGDPRDQELLYIQMGIYIAATLALLLLYGWVLRLSHQQRLHSPLARHLALACPVVFNLVLMIGRPYFSTDIYTYIAHGYLGVSGSNPYQIPARDVIDSAFGRDLVPWGWRPVHGLSPYGPLWTQVEIAVFRLTQDISATLLLLKMVVVSASLGSAALIWKILGRVRPQDQLLGTLAYLWNPVIVVELASEGHNDALMVVFVLLSLYLAIRLLPSLALAALLVGVSSKFLPLILLPAQLVFFWRRRRSLPQVVLESVVGLAAGCAVIAALYWPVWIGPETLQGVREQGRPSFYTSALVPVMTFLQRYREEAEARQLSLFVMSGLFGLFAFIMSARVRNDYELLQASAWIALAYILLVSPTFWAWYTIFPLALMALAPHGIFRVMLFVLPFCARLIAPIDDIAINGFLETVWGYRHPVGAWGIEVWASTMIGLTIPLLLCVYLGLRSLLVRRWQSSGHAPTADVYVKPEREA